MSAHTTTICPPSPQQFFYDEHVEVQKHHPVEAHSTGCGNFESTGLSFDDYFRMGTEKHKLFCGRRTTVPVWAVNDHDLQRVLVAFLEIRAYGKHSTKVRQVDTLLERIARAEKQLAERAPFTSLRLDVLCARYVELQHNGGNPRELAKLEQAIKALDTFLITSRSPARITAAVIYKYYRLGYKSTQIASDLGLQSPGVRQMLFRIQCTARALGYPEPEQITSYPKFPKMSLAQKTRRERKKLHALSQ
jgi:hypothetical protein